MTAANISFNTRSSVSLFLNTRVDLGLTSGRGAHGHLANLGNWCLTPVRYLFNGDCVTMPWTLNPEEKITHKKEFDKKSFLGTIISIVLIVPGLLAGSFFKGLAYLSSKSRNVHLFAARHYPLNYTLGTARNRCDFDTLTNKMKEIKKEIKVGTVKSFQPVNLTLYLKQGVAVPGYIELPENINKIIVVGTTLTSKSLKKRLKDEGWESGITASPNPKIKPDNTTIITQWKVDSVQTALNDNNDKTQRVYIVD